ncbi:PAS domain-containing protein [Streptomyces sp. TP-A0874]|uniref:PAS domain-containing protein n=1 Tax=Streptomyces sp. TP-A0874 TaxID=549819 RepID=UPI000853E30D|nr:PAS domain-containing protein [Streptomyces sp. TP-A0874]
MSSRPSRGAARLAAILDALPDALLLVNCNGTVVNANTIALETFESPGTGLVGRGLLDLLPSFDSNRIPGSMRRPDDDVGGRTKPTRMVARRTDGSEFLVEVTSANLEDGRTTYESAFEAAYADHGGNSYTGNELLMLVVRDLTGTVDTEAELARQQRQTEMILRAAAEGVIGVDTDGKVVLVNPAAAQILGYRASDLGGRELHTLIYHSRPDGSALPYEETSLADSLRSGRKHRVRGQVLWTKSGQPVPVDLTTAPVRDGDQLVGAVMTFTDRRKYDSLAARHAQLVAMLDQSLSGPLAELRGELTNLAADPAGQLWPEANQVLHHLAAGYARMSTLMENVLGYQRLDAGQEHLVLRRVSLEAVVAEAVEAAVELIGPGRAQFAVHAPPIEAEVDPERFATALAHLIADVAGVDATGNAPAGAGAGDSTIVVAAAKRGEVVRIEVRGPYPGGDPVHEPIVRGIVRRHGGVLQTHEMPGGGGSSYVLEVPLAGEGGVAEPGPSAAAASSAPALPARRTPGRAGPAPAANEDTGAGGPQAAVAGQDDSMGGTMGGFPMPGGSHGPTPNLPDSNGLASNGPATEAPPQGGAGAAAAPSPGTPRDMTAAHAPAQLPPATRPPAPPAPEQHTPVPEQSAPRRRRARPAARPESEGRSALVDPRTAGAGAPRSADGESGQWPAGVPGHPVDGAAASPGIEPKPTGRRRGRPSPAEQELPPGAYGAEAAAPQPPSGRRARREQEPEQPHRAELPPGAAPWQQNGGGQPPAPGQEPPQGGEAVPEQAPRGRRRRVPEEGVPAADNAPVPAAVPRQQDGAAAQNPYAGADPGAAHSSSGQPSGRRARRALAEGHEKSIPAQAGPVDAGGPRQPFALPPAAADQVPPSAAPDGHPRTATAGPPEGPAHPAPYEQHPQHAQDTGAEPRHTPPTAHPLPGGGPQPLPVRPRPEGRPAAPPDGYDGDTQSRAISVRTLGQGVPFAQQIADRAQSHPAPPHRATHTAQPNPAQQHPAQPPAPPSTAPARQPHHPPQQPQFQSAPPPPPAQSPAGNPAGPPGRRRKLATPPAGDARETTTQSPAAPAAGQQPPTSPPPRLMDAGNDGRAYAIQAPVDGAEGPEHLDGPNGAVDVTDSQSRPPLDAELPPEPLDNPRRLLVWPAPDVSTQQVLSDRGYRPVIVNSREEVDAQIAAYPAALFVDPLTGPITRTALQSLRSAAVAAEVPVLVTAGLGQATRETAYGADPAVLLKALAPRDSEQHPPRVLLIEENEAIAGALVATLERRGIQAGHAATDADAVALATRMRPNLVVMDLFQVRRRQAGIVDWLRANGLLSRTPLVVYTASEMDPAQLPRLASGETVLFLAERSTSEEVQVRIVDLLAKIGAS